MSSSQSNGKTVLITGINGYIASVLGLEILSKGYNLRGTTRSKYRAAALLDHAYKDYASRVEIFEVRDMTEPGAFDEAVRGTSDCCRGRWDIVAYTLARGLFNPPHHLTNGLQCRKLERMGTPGR